MYDYYHCYAYPSIKPVLRFSISISHIFFLARTNLSFAAAGVAIFAIVFSVVTINSEHGRLASIHALAAIDRWPLFQRAITQSASSA